MPVFFYIDPELADDFNCRWAFFGAVFWAVGVRMECL
jgi:hypothetical protein